MNTLPPSEWLVCGKTRWHWGILACRWHVRRRTLEQHVKCERSDVS